MNWLSNKLFYTIGITLLCGGLHAQSLAEAKKLYNEGKYAEAKPAFEKLVKQAPSNSSYNHWYGVCCYETGDLTGAEKHLKVAVKRKVQEAYRYMSEVYYKTYRFDEAGEMLEEYINLLAKKKQDPQSFETKLDLANNAQRMMEKVEDVQIIDSLVVDKGDFLSAYKRRKRHTRFLQRFFPDKRASELDRLQEPERRQDLLCSFDRRRPLLPFYPVHAYGRMGGRETITDEHQQQ